MFLRLQNYPFKKKKPRIVENSGDSGRIIIIMAIFQELGGSSSKRKKLWEKWVKKRRATEIICFPKSFGEFIFLEI